MRLWPGHSSTSAAVALTSRAPAASLCTTRARRTPKVERTQGYPSRQSSRRERPHRPLRGCRSPHGLRQSQRVPARAASSRATDGSDIAEARAMPYCAIASLASGVTITSGDTLITPRPASCAARTDSSVTSLTGGSFSVRSCGAADPRRCSTMIPNVRSVQEGAGARVEHVEYRHRTRGPPSLHHQRTP